MSNIARVFLILHVTMAVIMVGAGYVYPLLMAKMKESGPNRVPLTRVMELVSRIVVKRVRWGSTLRV